MKRINRRMALLLIGLASSAALAIYGNQTPKVDVVQPTRTTSRPTIAVSVNHAATQGATILALQPREIPDDVAEAFPVRNWAPPPPPPPPPAPPPKPTAPPLPFAVLGMQRDNDEWQVFLGRRDDTFVVKAGDMLDGRYRVDSITPPTMTLTYLPLKERQTLTIGTLQ